ALALQRRRRDAESTRDLNQLLLSLLAHDLRAPLQLSAQAMDYVRDQIQAGRVPEPALVADTAERTHRSLGAIEAVLAFARREAETAGETSGAAAAAGEVRDEVASFSATAARAGKELRFADGAAVTAAVGNPLVLRQVLSILLDNAVRYASPGVVAVSLAAEGREVVTRVADGGPGFSVHRSAGRGDGAGLGIELAAALARRAGGRLELESDGPAGTRWALHLPAVRGR
ncbi:MAG TPA: ATP-binding protein, partial [Longimicrobiaceae bacterium]|nr:ATP-binding protein [Longimicrobiaceae bacterium]